MTSWSDFTPMGKALIYVRDTLKLTKTTNCLVVREHMRHMLYKGDDEWTRADLTALATGAIILLAEKLCPGESSTPELPASESTESTPTTQRSG